MEKFNLTKCFICGLERFNFENSGIDFDDHKEYDHNVWDYVYFLIFMKSKTEKDCNEIESQIFEKIRKGDLTWFPRGRSMSLGNF